MSLKILNIFDEILECNIHLYYHRQTWVIEQSDLNAYNNHFD